MNITDRFLLPVVNLNVTTAWDVGTVQFHPAGSARPARRPQPWRVLLQTARPVSIPAVGCTPTKTMVASARLAYDRGVLNWRHSQRLLGAAS
jgi:hypothetical protein